MADAEPSQRPPAALVELRVLDGGNLYFPRPAVKLTLDARALHELDEAAVRAVAGALGFPDDWDAGPPGSEHRRRVSLRLAARIVRGVAAAAGLPRPGVRSRPGPAPDLVVVAWPWRRRGTAEAIGLSAARVLDALSTAGDHTALVTSLEEAIAAGGADVAAAPRGERPSVPAPTIPTVAVTGTNGKTTVTRLIAHIARCAGHRPGWTSTDGVYLDGELVEPGDWSGFGGAGRVLAAPGITFAVLETARGGLLLRGVGATHNDVAVVTNVSADHLGLHGVDTVDQLAEVKATVVRVTRPDGWVVLNAEDPRVLAMSALTQARVFAFALDADAPGIGATLDAGGRAATVIDGDLAIVETGGAIDHLVPLDAVPMALAGLSRHNVANALAGAAAALAAGVDRAAVARGLITFLPDPTLNPGRMNLFALDGRTVIVDLAHNEDGLRALLDVARGVRPPGGRVLLALGLAGDRTDEILRGVGEVAGRGADAIVIAHKRSYLRGRDPDAMADLLRTGIADGGGDTTDVPAVGDEVGALDAVWDRSRPSDVLALMVHEDRDAVYRWLDERGATMIDADGVRALAAAGAEDQR